MATKVLMSDGRAGIGPVAALVLAALVAAPLAGAAQEARIEGSAVAISSAPGGRAELELRFADGDEHVVAFRDGVVRVDSDRIGPYRPGGALEAAWREFLRAHAGGDAERLAEALRDWAPPMAEPDAATARALRERIDRLLGLAPPPAAVGETATVTGPEGTQLSIAPGGLSFESLSRSLERLQEGLEALGEAASGAEERLALIVHDDFELPRNRAVPGNLALLDGTLRVEGTVRGDVLVLDGTLLLEPPARVEGDVLQVGGSLENRGGDVMGEILSIREVAPAPADAPRARKAPRPPKPSVVEARHRERGFFDRIGHYIGNAVEGLTAALSAFIGMGILGLIAVYFARPQVEVVADTSRYSFGRSFAMGLAGQVLFFPVLLILCVLVITWLVIPFFLIGVALALLGGYLAVAHAVGEGFARRRYRYEWLERIRRSNSYYYLLSGLALLLAPFAIAAVLWVLGGLGGFLRGLVIFAAWVVTWVAATTGFGSILLTRAGTRKEYAAAAPWRAGGDIPGGGAGPHG